MELRTAPGWIAGAVGLVGLAAGCGTILAIDEDDASETTRDAAVEETSSDAAPDGGAPGADATDALTLPPSDPGKVACGGAQCPAFSQGCCLERQGGVCNSLCTRPHLRCDEKSDCGGDTACCFAATGASCVDLLVVDCPESLRMCKLDAECPSGKCHPHACPDGIVRGSCSAEPLPFCD